jgi:hypothetical protein
MAAQELLPRGMAMKKVLINALEAVQEVTRLGCPLVFVLQWARTSAHIEEEYPEMQRFWDLAGHLRVPPDDERRRQAYYTT